MKIRIHVTKEIYRKAMFCGHGIYRGPEKNCAIACAVIDIAPNAKIFSDYVDWNGGFGSASELPIEAKKMIRKFDRLQATPQERIKLPEFSFEVDFPDELVSEIGINEVHKILKESETLELAQ